jgi:hypothetical protein
MLKVIWMDGKEQLFDCETVSTNNGLLNIKNRKYSSPIKEIELNIPLNNVRMFGTEESLKGWNL